MAPLISIRLALRAAGLVFSSPSSEGEEKLGLDPETVDAILEEAARFAANVIAPLNQPGDREGAKLEGDAVRTPKGFAAAYKQYADAGWNAVPFDPEYGGQGLPWLVAFALGEMWQSASMAFGLCPLLTQGAVEAISRHGSDAQKQIYLEKLVSGAWTGTMNLTESQAGSDLAAIRTRAVRDGDRFRLFGQKIYITYGEHGFTPNIVHMVLARIEGAPAGVKGISLFIAPKFLPDANGEPGTRNDLRCVSLEHKLGIHASPTAVMAFGDDEGAVAWLVGEENRGLEYMFTMMNNARLSVGLQGVAIAERAYQQALAYARTRVQGRTLLGGGLGGETIFGHPDVRRMLLHMKTLTFAARCLTYYAAACMDAGLQARVELLTPIVKAWATDIGCEVASLGIQVHGGMGYVEETGAAQHLRDARIAPIYEGTNGIQAADLVFRKTLRDKGAAAQEFVAEMREVATAAGALPIGPALSRAIAALDTVIAWMVAEGATSPAKAAAGAYPYLQLFGLVAGGFMMARATLLKDADDSVRAMARYYAEMLLPAAEGLAAAAVSVHGAVMEMPAEGF